jgi:REP element-mobilizing transposase RayT
MYRGGYNIKDQHAVYFLTFTVVQWADVFSRDLYSEIILESLKYCQEKKFLKVHAWCIMSNHVHIICSSKSPQRLSDTLRDLKQYTSRQVIDAIESNSKESRKGWLLWLFKAAAADNKRNENFQFWQQTNHPIECSTSEILQSRINYIHQNPVKRKIVEKAEEYYYSSAMDYYKGEQTGKLEISFL